MTLIEDAEKAKKSRDLHGCGLHDHDGHCCPSLGDDAALQQMPPEKRMIYLCVGYAALIACFVGGLLALNVKQRYIAQNNVEQAIDVANVSKKQDHYRLSAVQAPTEDCWQVACVEVVDGACDVSNIKPTMERVQELDVRGLQLGRYGAKAVIGDNLVCQGERFFCGGQCLTFMGVQDENLVFADETGKLYHRPFKPLELAASH